MRFFLPSLTCLAIGAWLVVLGVQAVNPHGAEVDDNDFAEFEDFDDDDDVIHEQPAEREGPPQQPKVVMAPEALEDLDVADDEDAVVEEDEDEFDHFEDEEEFEGFDKDSRVKGKGQDKPPDLTITPVPLHLRTNWDSFYMEMLMLAGLGVYFLNFLAGKTKNSKLAQAWLSSHRKLLEENFAIVGDDGQSTEVQSGVLMKESENIYSLWCSGRLCVEGMLVTLKLLKRQDLVSTISRLFRPQSDQITIRVTMESTEMEPFVMCLANKKTLAKLHKEMVDLACFCPEKKRVDHLGLPQSFQLLSEIPEATSAVLDTKVLAAVNKYEQLVEFIHISDQYSGPKAQDDSQPSKMPETQKVLLFCFNGAGKGKCSPRDMEAMTPLMQMVFHCVNKVNKIRLSKDAKAKADRNRQKMTESYSKMSHAQRSEAAQERKESKRRAEKDRLMNEDDPDKQRKLEEKLSKKEAKKKQPKVKMMKMKAM